MAPIESSRTLSDYAFIALSIYGALVGSYYMLKVFMAVLRIFALTGTNLKKYAPKGTWVVITGASDGIGKEFAIQLAMKGYNLILISRTESKLAQLSADLESKYNVKTKFLAMDFALNLNGDYARVAQLIEGVDIGILVNNVGKSHDMPTPFISTEKEELDGIINVNCFATLRMTQLVIPGMIQRKRGLILTMSSFAGLTPTPLLATYSGSKAFLSAWGTALSSELKPHGIHVETVNSYLVTSAMSKVRKPSLLIPTPNAFVKSALKKVGVYVGGQTNVVTPYWTHALMHWFIENVPGLGSPVVLNVNKNMHEDIRRRALRKKERDAKRL